MIAWSRLRFATGDVDGATDLMSRGAELREDTLALVLTTGSEEQKRLYLRTLVDETDIAVSLHLGSAPTSPAAARLALTKILRRKGRSIDARADQIGTLRRHLNETDGEVLNQLSQAQSRLATIVLRGVATDEQRQSVTTLRRRDSATRTDDRRPQLRVPGPSRRGTLREIQDALPGRAALIESFRTGRFSSKTLAIRPSERRGMPRTCLRGDGLAGSVDLGEAALIDRDVQRFRRALSIPRIKGTQGRPHASPGRDGSPPGCAARRGADHHLARWSAQSHSVFGAGRAERQIPGRGLHDLLRDERPRSDPIRDIGPDRSRAVAPPAIVANPLFEDARRVPGSTREAGRTQASTRACSSRPAISTPFPARRRKPQLWRECCLTPVCTLALMRPKPC